jgi:hypothetical protein
MPDTLIFLLASNSEEKEWCANTGSADNSNAHAARTAWNFWNFVIMETPIGLEALR